MKLQELNKEELKNITGGGWNIGQYIIAAIAYVGTGICNSFNNGYGLQSNPQTNSIYPAGGNKW
jgi:lactobin A/cerein 7B family class IIb bacteriocin